MRRAVLTQVQVSAVGLYTTAKWALPLQANLASDSTRKPSFLVTSGGLYKDPWAPYFSLSMAKAAQHSLTMSLSQEFSKKGVHVAAVVVHGLVKPESKYFSPKKIAEVFWGLYGEGKDGQKEVWVQAPEEDESSKKWKARVEAGDNRL
jgi:NAD(P)-dependent dehydrogenase (short-subunit alcohol dehydrogenase family)